MAKSENHCTTLKLVDKAICRLPWWLESECQEVCVRETRRPIARGERELGVSALIVLKDGGVAMAK